MLIPFFLKNELETPNTYGGVFKMQYHSEKALIDCRNEILHRIWPSGIPITGIDGITTNVSDPLPTSASNLASVDRLLIHVSGMEDRIPYIWHPINPNGKFVLFCPGHFFGAGDGYETTYGCGAFIRDLINANYTVCLFWMPISNGHIEGAVHSYPTVNYPYQTIANLHYFLDIPIKLINQYYTSYTDIYCSGISGGGWTTTLLSALDERIKKGAAIAGTLPLYDTDAVGMGRDWEQHLPGLTDLVEYTDLYLMGTTKGRYHRNFLNATEGGTDPVGFNFVVYSVRPYEPYVSNLSNRFELVWDYTTLTHRITPTTSTNIINYFTY